MTATGLLDTSVVIDWHDPAVRAALPDEGGDLGHHRRRIGGRATARIRCCRPDKSANRPGTRSWPLSHGRTPPFDAAAARSYGLVAAAALGNGPHPRTRFADLLIAATAHTCGLDLYTRNIADFGGLEDLIRVVGV